jgi:hypothetical protein
MYKYIFHHYGDSICHWLEVIQKPYYFNKISLELPNDSKTHIHIRLYKDKKDDTKNILLNIDTDCSTPKTNYFLKNFSEGRINEYIFIEYLNSLYPYDWFIETVS